MKDFCIAHRGFSSVAPENTMAAIKLAMEEPYVQWVEVDVQMSKDGIPVLFHDFKLRRITGTRGWLKDRTLDELKQLDAGSWKSSKYAGEPIITLEELLQAVKGRLKIDLEIKTEQGMYPGIEQKIIDIVKQFEMLDEVVLTSFDRTVLENIKNIDPEITTGLITNRTSPNLIREMTQMGASYLSIKHKRLNAGLVSQAVKAGIHIMVWTVDHSWSMRRITALDPNIMICTNRPDVWRRTFLDSDLQNTQKQWWRLGR